MILYEALNEMETIVIFVAMAEKLGYRIALLRPQYPDAVLARLSDGEQCRVEFEYKSRNFYAHGHDPQDCDMIVCWKDNWTESPLPILELEPLWLKECAGVDYQRIKACLNSKNVGASMDRPRSLDIDSVIPNAKKAVFGVSLLGNLLTLLRIFF